MRAPKGRILPAIRPNAGLRIAYQARMDDIIDAMHADVSRAVVRCYRGNEPAILAADASPAMALRTEMRRLGRKWLKRFDELAPELAKYFATRVADRTDRALKDALAKAGMTVKLKLTAAQNDAVQAAIGENVALIKSIGSEYFTQVEGMVMRSVQAGRDLGTLNTELLARVGITKRRAALIARDQVNKSTAVIHRVRQVELGLKATWLHSAGGKTPRKSHVAQSGKEYDPATGWFDPDLKEWIWPGTAINCRCVSRSVVPGFD